MSAPDPIRPRGGYPIFYDPTRRRRPVMMTLALLLSLAGTIFCVSMVLLPLLPAVHVPKPHFARDLDLSNPALTSRDIFKRRYLLNRDKARLKRLVKREQEARTSPRPSAASPRPSGTPLHQQRMERGLWRQPDQCPATGPSLRAVGVERGGRRPG